MGSIRCKAEAKAEAERQLSMRLPPRLRPKSQRFNSSDIEETKQLGGSKVTVDATREFETAPVQDEPLSTDIEMQDVDEHQQTEQYKLDVPQPSQLVLHHLFSPANLSRILYPSLPLNVPTILGNVTNNSTAPTSLLVVKEFQSMDQNVKLTPNEKKRYNIMATDEWIADFNEHEVLCRGCGLVFQMEKPNKFYMSNFRKHKGKCSGVRKGEKIIAKAPHLNTLLSV
ncbi:hypothetical protein VKT23_011651 [Stygiomarasmius scandens]|uniref:Uncharacterized protein n=1 Tax=Marasmiellus scandens TaxID=2682957 RepID=A0ABR1J7P6_9AGAR